VNGGRSRFDRCFKGRLEVAKRRLSAELKVVGRPLVSTDFLVRPGVTPQGIVNQSETATLEISRVLDELAPGRLLTGWPSRSSATE
jgi:Ethanolamine utilization protein EutJ (predicted chaperonin)